MKNTIGLAVEFIRRAVFVDANALLEDECVSNTRNLRKCSFTHCSRTVMIRRALKHVADMLGCMTYIESRLSVKRWQ